jgi:hypothetical protein
MGITWWSSSRSLVKRFDLLCCLVEDLVAFGQHVVVVWSSELVALVSISVLIKEFVELLCQNLVILTVFIVKMSSLVQYYAPSLLFILKITSIIYSELCIY